MSEPLHWVECDPARRVLGHIEPSARVHLSRRARIEKLRKLNANTNHSLSSKAREIVGWYQQPKSRKGQTVNRNDIIGMRGSDSTIHATSAISTDTSSFNIPQPSCFAQSLEHDVPRLHRTINTSYFVQCNDFTGDLIKYTTTHWLPSPESTPQNCHIGGHVPIYASDELVAQSLLCQAFQSRCKFLQLALSAFVSARMQFVSRIQPRFGHEPEHFCLQAIRVLQAEIGVEPTRLIFPDRDCLEPTALGLAFLMLTASFVHSDGRAIRVYGQMLSYIVAEMGGIDKLSDFASYFVVATDFLTATANLCSLSLRFESTDRNIKYIGARLPASINHHCLLRPVIDMALSFDEVVVSEIRSCLGKYSARYYHTVTTTIQPNSEAAVLAARTDPTLQDRLVRAADLQSHARYLAISLWLRILTLQALEDAQMSLGLSDMLSPNTLSRDSARVLELLHDAQIQIQDTGWMLPCWIVVWTLSLTSCIPRSQGDDDRIHHDMSPISDIVRICKITDPTVVWDKPTIASLTEEAVPLHIFRKFDRHVAENACGVIDT